MSTSSILKRSLTTLNESFIFLKILTSSESAKMLPRPCYESTGRRRQKPGGIPSFEEEQKDARKIYVSRDAVLTSLRSKVRFATSNLGNQGPDNGSITAVASEMKHEIESVEEISSLAKLIFTLPEEHRMMIFNDCVCAGTSSTGNPILPSIAAAFQPNLHMYTSVLKMLYNNHTFVLNPETFKSSQKLKREILPNIRRLHMDISNNELTYDWSVYAIAKKDIHLSSLTPLTKFSIVLTGRGGPWLWPTIESLLQQSRSLATFKLCTLYHRLGDAERYFVTNVEQTMFEIGQDCWSIRDGGCELGDWHECVQDDEVVSRIRPLYHCRKWEFESFE
ncbi:hypothetical protein B0J14DRAFT_645587 [Halenospora varia]|nr:hypothetical protein B0J14DRAFT_645587 [Halenospora varia]